MQGKMVASSTGESSHNTALPSRFKLEEQARIAVPDNLVLQSISNNRNIQSAQFYYTDVAAPNGKPRGYTQDSTDSFVRQPQLQKADVKSLLAANEKLRFEVRTLRKKNVVLSGSLANLSQQLNMVLQQQATAQAYSEKVAHNNAVLSQRVAFYEQKLEEYIVAAIESDSLISDLSTKLDKMSRQHAAELATVKLGLISSPKVYKSLNLGSSVAVEIVDKPNKGFSKALDLLEPDLVPSQGSGMLDELLSALNCLFKDRSSGQCWRDVQTIVAQLKFERGAAEHLRSK